MASDRTSTSSGNRTLSNAKGVSQRSEESINPDARRFIALIDVLGFSDLVARESSVSDLRKYLRALKVSMEAEKSPDIQYVAFSDSIVLTTSSMDLDAFKKLIRRCSRLMFEMLSKGIAIRGAISCGRCLRETLPGGTFVAGLPIVEAYRYEQLQDWVGIMVAPSIHTEVPDLKMTSVLADLEQNWDLWEHFSENRAIATFLQPASIPFHDRDKSGAENYDGFAIVPTRASTNSADVVKRLCTSIEQLDTLRGMAPTPASQKKYERTQKWLTDIFRKWKRIEEFESTGTIVDSNSALAQIAPYIPRKGA